MLVPLLTEISKIFIWVWAVEIDSWAKVTLPMVPNPLEFPFIAGFERPFEHLTMQKCPALVDIRLCWHVPTLIARSSEELGNTSSDVAKRWHYWEIRVSLKTAISFFVLGVKIPNVPLVSWQPVQKEKKMCVKKKKNHGSRKVFSLVKGYHWSNFPSKFNFSLANRKKRVSDGWKQQLPPCSDLSKLVMRMTTLKTRVHEKLTSEHSPGAVPVMSS